MKTALILFAKHPVAGSVKTRLIPKYGITGAYSIYCKLLSIIFLRFKQCKYADFIVYSDTPKQAQGFFQGQNLIKQQVGQNLGEKMFHALSNELQTYQKIILFGADCPFITDDIIAKVINSLNQHDQVFIPANDGGYVLIGAKKITAEIFDHISWSTNKVMQQTENNLQSLGANYQLLSALDDIDTPSDVEKIKHLLIDKNLL